MVRVGRMMMVLMLSGLALLLIGGCGSSAVDKAGGTRSHPLVLTLADGESDFSNAQPFASAVKQISKGTLRIAIKALWGPNDPRFETDLIKGVETGRAQMGIVPSRAFDTVGIDSFQAVQAPFLIDGVALERKVLASDLTERMLAGLKPAGLVGLAILPGPLRRPLGFTRSLLSVSDFHSARIGIRPSAVAEKTLRSLGAIPVFLQRNSSGTSGLDGVESHLAGLDAGFAERGATVAGNVDFEPRPNVIFINQRTFDSLSPAQQRVLIRAGAQVQMTGAVYQPDDGSVQDLCRRGIKIVTASATDLAGLRTAVGPVYAELESHPSTKAFIEEITSMRQALGGSPDAASCPTAAARSGTAQAATMLDGKWEVTYTRGEFFAAGADPGEDLPSNWGHQSLTLDRGHWLEIGPDVGPGAGPASGKYVVSGGQVTFDRSDRAYPGSDTEIWGPYTWSVYRDALTFRKSRSFGQGPTSLVVKPWRRSGSTG